MGGCTMGAAGSGLWYCTRKHKPQQSKAKQKTIKSTFEKKVKTAIIIIFFPL
jgi:hypothetical protein